MDYFTKITNDLKQALKEKNKRKIEAVRAIKSELLLIKTQGSDNELKEADFIKLIQKMIKQRKDAAALYEEKGRKELAENEKEQAKYLEEYLPKQLSDEELEAEIKKIIEQTGANSIKEMGKIMGIATKKFFGRAENRKISEIVKKLLN